MKKLANKNQHSGVFAQSTHSICQGHPASNVIKILSPIKK